MMNVIQFLEAMGSNAAMSRMSTSDYEAAVATLDVNQPLRESLLRRDHVALGHALNAREILLCMIFAPEEEAPVRQGDDTPEAAAGE